MTRIALASLATFALLSLAACAADPTPTAAGGGATDSTPTPPPLPAPPLSEPCPPSSGGVVYEVAEVILHDEGVDLLMGPEGHWGYQAGQRLSSVTGGIVIETSPGDTIRLNTLRSSALHSSGPHALTIPALGIHLVLAPGEELEQVDIRVCELGTFTIQDGTEPVAGFAYVVVAEPPAPPTATPTATPRPPGVSAPPQVYELEAITIEDGFYQLRMGATTAWGYDQEQRINSNDGDGIKISVNVGDTLRFGVIRSSTSRSTETHSLINEELGFNITLDPGTRVEPFEITIEAAGTFVLDDPSKPGSLGTFVIEVAGGAGGAQSEAAQVYELEAITIEDGFYQLRMGATTAWGYDQEQRINSNDGDGIKISVNVGDTLRFGVIRSSTSRSTETHSLINEELGFNITLDPGTRVEPFEITIEAAGTFVLDDPSKPGSLGTFVIEAQ